MVDKTILIFADANRRASLTAARILSKHHCRLLFCIHEDFPEKLTSILFKKYSSYPLLMYSSEGLIDFLNQLHQTYGSFEILPIGEWHIRQILNGRKHLSKSIHFCLNNPEGYHHLSNKLSFTKLCKNYKLDLPEELNTFPKDDSISFVVKPDSFEKSDGVLTVPMLVDSPKQYKAFKAMNLDLSRHFFQEYISGPSIYYCAYYLDGKCIKHFGQFNRIQQPNGKSIIKAHPYEIPKATKDKIDSIFKSFNWNGPMMFELKHCKKTQKLYAIECNPRLWGPLQICIDNGVDMVSPCFGLPSFDHANNKPIGYLWLSGFIHGYILKHQSNQDYQIFKAPYKTKLKYKDLYLRKDSIKYFVFDLLYHCKELVKQILKS